MEVENDLMAKLATTAEGLNVKFAGSVTGLAEMVVALVENQSVGGSCINISSS
jgi:hypothetical protein